MIAAITSFFNPNHCVFRSNNYQKFHQGIKDAGVPLYTIEIAFGDSQFELNRNDANFLMQERTTDLMFQKERSLNILLEQVPDCYDEIIWIDCDVTYLENDWPDRISSALRNYVVIQPYSHSITLPDCSQYFSDEAHLILYDSIWGSSHIRRGYAYYDHKRKDFANLHLGSLGYAWAARRDFLERHKLYDAIVTGAGDLFIAMALFGHFNWIDWCEEFNHMPDPALVHYFDWAFPVRQETKGKVGFTTDLILHHWHGDTRNRNYLKISKALQQSKFNPNSDIALDENQLWKWNSNNILLQKSVQEMFLMQKYSD